MKKYVWWILPVLLVIVLVLSWFFYFRYLPVFQKKAGPPQDNVNNMSNIAAEAQNISGQIKDNEKKCFKIKNVVFSIEDIIKEENKIKRPDFEETMSKIPERDRTIYRNKLRQNAVQNVLKRIYVDFYIEDNKIVITEAQVEKTMKEFEDRMRLQYEESMRQNNLRSNFDLEAYLNDLGFSLADFRRDMLYQTKFEAVLTPIKESLPVSTDQEIKDYYESRKEMFNEPPGADIDVILTDSEEKVDAALNLLNSGNTWENVCAKFSQVPVEQTKLGLTAKTDMPEEMAKVVFDSSTKVNIPFKVKFMTQWYVVKVNSFRQGVVHTFTEVKDRAEEALRQNKINQAFDQLMNDLAEKYGKPEPTKC